MRRTAVCVLAVLTVVLTPARSQCILGNVTLKHNEVHEDCTVVCKCRYGDLQCVSRCPPSVQFPSEECPNPVRRKPKNECCEETFCDPCPEGRFGLGCTDECGQCTSGRCNITTGVCLPGDRGDPLCLPGYFGNTCKMSCPDGMRGPRCAYKCGKCAGGHKQCDVVSGACLKESPKCLPGWRGKTCFSKCKEGTYGADCVETCGACAAGKCNILNGTCLLDTPLCKAGYYGNLCKDACPPGTFGALCKWDCGGCAAGEKTCHAQTGECPEAEPRCKPGYMGVMCKACEMGTWGMECVNNCSENCARGELECDRRDGTCLGGCQPGYYGNQCVAQQADSNLSIVVGVAVGVGALILVTIMVGTLIYLYCTRRRHMSSSKVNLERRDSYLTPQPSPDSPEQPGVRPINRVGTYELPVTNTDPFFYTPIDEDDTMIYEMMLPRTNWKVNMEDLEMTSTTMIQGNFGQTTLTMWHHNVDRSLSTPVAVKRFPGNDSDEDKNMINVELEKLRSLDRCVNVLAVLGGSVDQKSGESLLLLEWTEKGSLLDYLKAMRLNTGESVEDRHRKLIKQCRGVVNGMEHISKEITNIDLSADTILLDEYMNPKITGLVHLEGKSQGSKPNRESIRMRCSAIETMTDNTHSVYSDVWRFGVLMWEVFSLGDQPYSELSLKHLQQKLESGYRLGHPPDAPTPVYVLMTECWNSTPNLRPSFRKLKLRLFHIKENQPLTQGYESQRDSGTYCSVD